MKAKYFILLVVIVTTALYIYQNDALQTNLLGRIHQVAPELNKSTLYKWKDSKGKWQITDTPPHKGISFTTITSQDQINVMPSPASKKEK